MAAETDLLVGQFLGTPSIMFLFSVSEIISTCGRESAGTPNCEAVVVAGIVVSFPYIFSSILTDGCLHLFTFPVIN